MRVRLVWKPGVFSARHRDDPADAPPSALVDVGCHILWGMDEGPQDLDQSLVMLNVAAQHGTTDLVAVPNASFDSGFDSDIVTQRVAELNARSDGSVRIHSGCTLHFGLGNIRDALANPRKYTINGLNHLRVEFAEVLVPPGTEQVLTKFRKAGLVPIISHPERNPILQLSLARLKAWVSMGCVLQVTARSLSGHFGKLAQQCAWHLLSENLVQVVASDAHDPLHRPPRLDGAWRLLKEHLGEHVAHRMLIDNPRAIIHGAASGRKPSIPIVSTHPAATGA